MRAYCEINQAPSGTSWRKIHYSFATKGGQYKYIVDPEAPGENIIYKQRDPRPGQAGWRYRRFGDGSKTMPLVLLSDTIGYDTQRPDG